MSWSVLPLDEVASIQGGIQKQPKRAPKEHPHPFLRVANVTAKGLDLADVHSVEIFDGELERYRLERGDLLVVEGNGSATQIGRAAVWDGSVADAVHQNHLIRVRPGPRIDPRFLGLIWNAPTIRRGLTDLASSSSGLHTLSVAKLKRVEVPIPPLDEQRRIVDILEDHLSRLDAAEEYLRTGAKRLKVLVKAVLLDLIPDESDYPTYWKRSTVDEAGHLSLGRQRHPDWHTGSTMKPYLRVANVFEDRIDTSDVMEMHWPDDTFDRFKLEPGDVLLNEGQSPHLLGRPAIYRGVPSDVAFTNSLLRFKAGDEVLPEFALLVFRRHMHAGRFARESRITTNIAHLSARRLKPIEFPIPPISEQMSIVDAARERLGSVSRIEAELKRSQTHALGLRRSLLAAAFSGRLTGSALDLSVSKEMVNA